MIDTHCHFNLSDHFSDISATIERARAVGVDRFIVVGIDDETSRIAVDLADRFEPVFATVGWHPTNTANWSDTQLGLLRDLVQHPKVVAVGEIGLDYHWDTSSPQDQARALFAQLDFAAGAGKPVVYHCREAYTAMLDLLEMRPFSGLQLFHCFVGNQTEGNRAVEMGCYFGVDGPITYKNASDLREVIGALPLDRLVLETDSPFLSPIPHRGKPNEPSFLPFIASRLAELQGVEVEEVASITTKTAERFFGLTAVHA